MNHIYRIVWNHLSTCWQVVAETANSHGKSHSRKGNVHTGALAAGWLLCASAWAGPTGGQVTAGTATINQTGSATTINQSSQNAAINWQTFSVGKSESVRFNQPNASAITLNRVTGTESSQILGSLTANGRVFILNPNGVLFGKGAQVSVGGIVASTGRMSDADFMAGNYKITGANAGSVINEGNINVAEGGVLAFIAPVVSNTGTLSAPQGSVLLAGAEAVTLKLQDGSLVGYTLDKGSLQAMVDNGGLIQADGGHVVLTAKGLDALSKATVNHSGIIEARTVSNKSGVVELLGDMEVGLTSVSGTIDASAPNGGNGGFVETSAAKVKIADSARMDTRAPYGKTGTWLLDPKDLNIRNEGGDMTGDAVASQLANTNVTLTSAQGSSEGQGAIRVQDSISWAANTTLTLTADGDILIEAPITGTGDRAGVVLNPSQNGGYDQYVINPVGRGKINLPGANATFVVNGQSFTLIHNLSELQALKDVGGNGYYALANDIDATATASWNGGAGFEPIYAGGNNYLRFDGLGHSINNLTINRPGQDDVGLFSWSSGLIRELRLESVDITGGTSVGAIAGNLIGNFGMVGIRQSMVSGTVRGQGQVGGAVGRNTTVIGQSSSSATVTGAAGYGEVGGLVGSNSGSIDDSFATGAVASGGGTSTGGGGLVGSNAGYISDSYATGNVTTVGGVDGNPFGGLVGSQSSGHISNSYATGRIIVSSGGGNPIVGGLVGADLSGDSTVDSSYFDIDTTGTSTSAGGTGMTTAAMKRQSTYAGWVFGWPWEIVDGTAYPQLSWAVPKTYTYNADVPEEDLTISFSMATPGYEEAKIAGWSSNAASGPVLNNSLRHELFNPLSPWLRPIVGYISNVSNAIEIGTPTGEVETSWRATSAGEASIPIRQGEIITTGTGSAVVTFTDGSMLRLNQGTVVELEVPSALGGSTAERMLKDESLWGKVQGCGGPNLPACLPVGTPSSVRG